MLEVRKRPKGHCLLEGAMSAIHDTKSLAVHCFSGFAVWSVCSLEGLLGLWYFLHQCCAFHMRGKLPLVLPLPSLGPYSMLVRRTWIGISSKIFATSAFPAFDRPVQRMQSYRILCLVDLAIDSVDSSRLGPAGWVQASCSVCPLTSFVALPSLHLQTFAN